MYEDFYNHDWRRINGSYIELDIPRYIKITATLRYLLYSISVACYILTVYIIVLKSFFFILTLLFGFLCFYLAKRVKTPRKASKRYLIGDTFCVVDETTLHFALANDYHKISLSKLVIIKSVWNSPKQKFKVVLQEKRKEETVTLYLTEKGWHKLAEYITH